MITQLIDKQDNFEIIRDQIAALLVLESANQMTLATAAGKDPSLWELAVFTERNNPWDGYNQDGGVFVNVWFDSSSAEGGSSDTVERQAMMGNFNIDVYGFGLAQDDGDGQITGDEHAARTAARGMRLVRNILMAGENTYLGLRGVVWRRMVSSLSSFQPPIDNREANAVLGMRLVLDVKFNEFSPQVEPVTLEYLSNQITRASDGRLLATVDYDFSGSSTPTIGMDFVLGVSKLS